MTKASIIIPTKNAESDIGPCLEAVFRQKYSEDFEVIVIDSGSTDNTLSLLDEFPVKLFSVKPEEFHHSKTRNYGVKLAGGDCLVFLNQDALPQDTLWLKTLTDNLKDPKVAGVSGRQIPRKETSPMESHWQYYFYASERKVLESPKNGKPVNVHNYNFYSTANCAMKREVMLKVPFPEIVIMSEDKAWCGAALMTGYSIIYEPEAVVLHSHNFTLKSVFQHCFDSGMSYAQYSRNWRESSIFSYLKQGSDYFIHEMFFMLRNGYAKHIPYAILYDTMKFSGRVLGGKYKYLPRSVVNRLCQHKQIYETMSLT